MAKAPAKGKYVLVRGKFRLANERQPRKLVEKGQVVELTPEQYEAFKDNFEPQKAYNARIRAAKEVAATDDDDDSGDDDTGDGDGDSDKGKSSDADKGKVDQK